LSNHRPILASLRSVAFVGIGGIGMSALARYFLQRGVAVSGYDRAETELTQALTAEGARIHYTDAAQNADPAADLVVYTPAIPADSAELAFYRAQEMPVYKRSDVLQWISEEHDAITVAGTHGKTTVSTMAAYLLREGGLGGAAFLGGIAANYGTNFWSEGGALAVIEADEYDRSFLKLRPQTAVLTSMDPDHLDIYGTPEAMEEAYIQYTRAIKPGGHLLVKHGLKRGGELTAENRTTYSLQNSAADAYAAGITQKSGGYTFDLISPAGVATGVRLPMGGMHNVENAVVAGTAAMMHGLGGREVASLFADFKGVKRRFEYVLRTDDRVFIDDYAHHPEELRNLISSAKRLFAGRKCCVAFQPHLFSRTRDLADGFAESLSLADEVLLLDIYPAREAPVPGVSSENIAEKMTAPVTILSKEGLLEWAAAARPSLFITAGAGDIDKLVEPLKEILFQH